MKRVVITGIGILSSIGNNKKKVLSYLKKGKSGVVFSKRMKNAGMNSHICGKIRLDKKKNLNRRILKFMNNSSLYAYFAMEKSIQDANLSKSVYQKNPRIGLIIGTGNSCFDSKIHHFNGLHKLKKNHPFSPYTVIKYMPSNISACLSTFYRIYGMSYSISSACATSSHCIAHASELIQFGKQDIIFAGGAEELSCESSFGFDSMKALSTKYNNFPYLASRAYDINRDGFVISGGSGILVIEELSHALHRNARIYAEIIGVGVSSDGASMIRPSKNGAIRSMKMAIKKINNHSIEYINTHATSTKIGDIIELKAIKEVFKNSIPYISSTKSITGHALGASGVHEIIYMILMMKNKFIAPSINIDNLDFFSKSMNIVLTAKYCPFSIGMSNSFGFGGVNVSIVIKNYC